MTASERRLILPLLRDVLKGMSVGMETRIEAVLERYSKKKPSKYKTEKAHRRATRAESTRKLREAVFARAGGRCEFCWALEPTEMHHLEGGSGRRREKQAESNCVGLCGLCHRGYHRRPLVYLAAVTQWASRYGYPMPSRFLRAPLASTSAPKEPQNEINQCDGCVAGYPRNEHDHHVLPDGSPFMGCERERYVKEPRKSLKAGNP